jgi:hypothetical protein
MSKPKLQVITSNEIDNWDTQFTYSGDISAFDKYKTLSKLHGLEDSQEKILNPAKIQNDIHNRKNAFQHIKNLFKFKKVCPCLD